MAKKEEYPEHEKLSAIKDQSQRIGEFLEWLFEEKKVELAFFHKHDKNCDGWDRRSEEIEHEYECDDKKHGRDTIEGHKAGMYGCNPKIVFGCTLPVQNLTPFRYTKESLLAEFFGIDLKKLENEKDQMLQSLRKKHEVKT